MPLLRKCRLPVHLTTPGLIFSANKNHFGDKALRNVISCLACILSPYFTGNKTDLQRDHLFKFTLKF